MSEYGVYEAKTKLAQLIKEVVEQRTREAILAIKRMRIAKIDKASFNQLRAQGRK